MNAIGMSGLHSLHLIKNFKIIIDNETSPCHYTHIYKFHLSKTKCIIGSCDLLTLFAGGIHHIL